MIEIKVLFNPLTGQVGVTGPLHDELLCLRLLARASGVVTENTLATKNKAIVPAATIPEKANTPIVLNV